MTEALDQITLDAAAEIDPVPQNVSGLNERNLAKSKLL